MALVVPLLLIITVTVGALGYLTLRNGTLTVHLLATRLIDEIGARTQERLLSLIDLPHRINEAHANAFALNQLDPDKVSGQERHFWRHLQMAGPISHSFFGNADGDFVGARLLGDGSVGTMLGDASTDNNRSYHYFATDSRGYRTRRILVRPKTDTRKRPWYTQAIEAKTDTWSQIYTAIDDGSLGITACRPVYDEDGVLQGALGANFKLAWIQKFLNSLEIGKSGELFIVERSGLLVSSSAPTSNTARRDGKISRIRATESQNEFIRQTARFIENRFGNFRTIKQAEKLEFDIEGDRHFLHIVRLQDGRSLDWVMVIALPEHDFMDQIRANNFSVFMVLATALLLAISTGILMARWILGPINRLNRSALALAQGDWKHAPDTQRQDELGQLARTFNKMAENIQSLLQNLRRNVSKLNKEVEQRKKAEEKLQEATFRRDEVIRAANVGLWDWDLTTDKVEYSTEWKQQIGYDDHEVQDDVEEWRSRVHPDDLEAVLEKTRKCITGSRQDYQARFRFRHKDGSYRWILAQASTAQDHSGRPILMRGSHVDITDLKRSEEKLQESRQKFRSMVDNIGIGVALISPEMEVLELNQRMRKWFPGIDAAHHPICYHAFNNPPRKKECDHCPTSKSIRDGKVHEGTITKDQAGSMRKFRIVSSPIVDSFGNVTAAIQMVEDITDRLRLEAHLRQSQKMESIGNLAGGIAHDFNNILSSVIGFTELALDDVRKGSMIEENLQEVYTAGKRAKALVAQILAFARQSEEELKLIQVDVIIKEVLNLIRSSIPTTIEIKKKINSDSLIMGNQTQVHQIMMNLCTNAVQAMEEQGGSLGVTLKDIDIDENYSKNIDLKPGNYIKLTVSDTGPGISSDIIDSIFEPYFTTKDPGEGTGMGLAMVQGIIESYGGKITVNSNAGNGTTFTTYLPVGQNRMIPSQYEPEQLPTGTERILIVDDEAPIAKMGSQGLERLGYKVRIKTSSVEALELFRAKPEDFDLIITDMTMPKMTGDKLAIELMKIRKDIPVILFTGYSKNISEESSAQIGIKAFAYKPIVKADLAKIVRKVLDDAKG